MSLIFIVADSLRHDHLGCTGGPVATPTVDGLADDGVLFERVISAAPWTVPSVASMLTGVHSHRLGVVQWKQPWPASAPSLFSLARAAGYEVASFVFDPAFLFCAAPEAGVRGSSQDTHALLSWIRDHRDERYVLFIHYWWTHVPYVDTPMSTAAWRQGADAVLEALRAGPEARDGVKRLYRRAVERFSEAWLPRVLDAADLDTTWVLLTADHGESWGERPDDPPPRDVFDLHGNGLWDEVLRVPLVVRPPGGAAPRRLGGLSRTVDLLPTLAELLGLVSADLAGMDGVSLAGWMREERNAPRGGDDVWGSEQTQGWEEHDAGMWGAEQGIWPVSRAVSAKNNDLLTRSLPLEPGDVWSGLSLTTSRYKLIWEMASRRRLAFDLRDDPSELMDISQARADDLQPHWDHLEEQWKRATVKAITDDDLVGLTGRLRDLGYL